jgi:hypothetical protein
MAKLSPEIRATLSQQKEQLLDIIDRAKSLEFTLLESVGENLEREHPTFYLAIEN